MLGRAVKRLLLVLADFTKEHSQLQVLPNWKHVNNARQLHHKLRRGVERIIVGRVEDINWPQVDILDVIRPK